MSGREPGGLFAGGQRVPLRGVSIDVAASGVAARVTVAQRYQNSEAVPVEAVYSFPLEESSAVFGFEVEMGGRRIVGRVEEKERAFERYDEAMAAGHGAYLLDQDRPNIFTASVGNLLPGQEAVVRLTYGTELEQRGNQIRLMIPTTISPRYIPQEQLKTMDPSELDHIAPPTVAGGVPYGLRLRVDLEAPADIESVECPSHPARIALAGRKVTVELMGSDIQLDQDFVLSMSLTEAHQASALVARDEQGDRVVMLNLFPDLGKLRRAPCEIIFLLDRSGSMMGTSISQAKNALLLCLRSLEEGDRFNIIGFGSTYQTLFPQSVPYGDSTLQQATAHVQGLDADLGGTELLAPLKVVMEGSPTDEMARRVLLLTDGEVSNEQDCLDLAARHAGRVQIFTFGIGHGASEFLVRGLARASRGAAEFIHPNERIETKVMRQFKRLAAAGLKNVAIEWGSLTTNLVAPLQLPPLYDGDRLTVYGRLTSGQPGEVAIVAEGPEGPLRFPVRVDTEAAAAGSAIPALMARRAIQDLEEGRSNLQQGGGSAQADRRDKRVRQAIVDLGCRYNLMSSATSFVAVEERPEGSQAQRAELRRVPIALTKGWHGHDQRQAPATITSCGTLAGAMAPFPFLPGAAPLPPSRPSPLPASMPMSAMNAPCAPLEECEADDAYGAPPAPQARKGSFLGRAAEALRNRKKRSAPQAQGAPPPSSYSPPPASPARYEAGEVECEPEAMADESLMVREDSRNTFMELTLAQRADGSWSLTGELAQLAGKPLSQLEEEARRLGLEEELARRVVATLVALHLLRTSFGSREDEWSMLAGKAERWLARHPIAVPQGHQDLEQWTRSVLGSPP